MFEIIPNWHPMFVHFTVALFSTSVVFYLLAYLTARITHWQTFATQFEIVARWCLWFVALITLGTVSAGLYAYYTVNHDEASHIAMTIHRNWALSTATAMLLIALWSGWRYYKHQKITLVFIIALLLVQGLLLSTAWRGAELVYRYGIGVLSLPKAEGSGHQHHHETVGASPMNQPISPTMTGPKELDHQDMNHEQ